jgi:putative redox protein
MDIRGCDVRLEAERAPTDPKVFTAINVHFTVRGRRLRANVVERAVQVSHEKYCSASVMLEKTAKITRSVEIIDDETWQPLTSPPAPSPSPSTAS